MIVGVACDDTASPHAWTISSLRGEAFSTASNTHHNNIYKNSKKKKSSTKISAKLSH